MTWWDTILMRKWPALNTISTIRINCLKNCKSMPWCKEALGDNGCLIFQEEKSMTLNSASSPGRPILATPLNTSVSPSLWTREAQKVAFWFYTSEKWSLTKMKHTNKGKKKHQSSKLLIIIVCTIKVLVGITISQTFDIDTPNCSHPEWMYTEQCKILQ